QFDSGGSCYQNENHLENEDLSSEQSCNFNATSDQDCIWQNVNSFLKYLNAETNAEARELIDEPDETKLDEVDDGQLEIDRGLELDLQNKISEIN
ncbi:14110_t:CDS:2, partial [Racocetra persica]